MKPLIIQDGIVMNAMIDHIPLEKQIVVAQGCVPNVRTQIPMDWPIGLTLHDAKGTASEWANKLQYIENNDTLLAGAHFFVDEQHIVQTLPVDEVSWQGMMQEKAIMQRLGLSFVGTSLMNRRNSIPHTYVPH